MNVEARLDNAFEPVKRAIADKRIPGAVLGYIDSSGNRCLRVEGFAQTTPVERPMQPGTWFDLASLTKVLYTTPEILKLHETGRLGIEQPLITVLPDLQQYNAGSWIRRITFRQCLSHESELPAVEPVYTYGRDAGLLRAFVLQRNWQRGPSVYSDINFILLGLALERIHGKRLRQLSVDTGFAFSANPDNCAATEYCTWRERVMCGAVHDDNCYALQGAGHAGLFGTADAILEHALGLLDGSGASPARIALMQTPVSSTRTLGWECKHPGWSGGSLCSISTIGHTGFTGTGLWIDFDNGHAWTLLCNRIHPTRHVNSGIAELRREVAERLYYD